MASSSSRRMRCSSITVVPKTVEEIRKIILQQHGRISAHEHKVHVSNLLQSCICGSEEPNLHVRVAVPSAYEVDYKIKAVYVFDDTKDPPTLPAGHESKLFAIGLAAGFTSCMVAQSILQIIQSSSAQHGAAAFNMALMHEMESLIGLHSSPESSFVDAPLNMHTSCMRNSQDCMHLRNPFNGMTMKATVQQHVRELRNLSGCILLCEAFSLGKETKPDYYNPLAIIAASRQPAVAKTISMSLLHGMLSRYHPLTRHFTAYTDLYKVQFVHLVCVLDA